MDEELILTLDYAGNQFWRNKDGRLHRLDGPAAEYVDGRKFWCQNGDLHRSDGPAIEWGDGAKEWWQNGLLHREDGPAVILSHCRKQWYLNHVCYKTKQEYFNALCDEDKNKCLFSEDFLNG